jgi:pimeloyl-ACP methyl ester carboxylesterase
MISITIQGGEILMNKGTLAKKYLETSFGNIAYQKTRSENNPPVLFVHDIPTSSFMWRHVLELLKDDFHCYAPDLMGLVDTEVDHRSDNFHTDAQADMLTEFMTSVGHEHFCVVCHDQGGAAVQIIAARNPKRINCLVINDCVCYDNWPVPGIKRLQALIRRAPYVAYALTKIGFFEWRETKTRFSNFRQAVFHPDWLSNEAIREYLRQG